MLTLRITRAGIDRWTTTHYPSLCILACKLRVSPTLLAIARNFQ